jgi:hypothetical protein
LADFIWVPSPIFIYYYYLFVTVLPQRIGAGMCWDGLENNSQSGTLPPSWDGLAAKYSIFRGMG